MSDISQATGSIKSILPDVISKLDEPLKNHTSFKIGGPVSVMYFPDNITSLTKIYDILNDFNITPLIMGNGSNILASDSKLDLVVINMINLNKIESVDADDSLSQEYGELIVESGTLLSKLAVFACEHCLSGIEFAHGIPGTAGGAVAMNAGAYGGEMKDIVCSTNAYGPGRGSYIINAGEHEFAYRKSIFTNNEDIILSTKIRLQKGDTNQIKQKMDELGIRRRESQPLDIPSGGSTFKRPKEGYAAAFIEQGGLKGFTIGGAQVSEKHTGFIVNRGDATFSDVMSVIEHVQKIVYERFGACLEPEIKIIR